MFNLSTSFVVLTVLATALAPVRSAPTYSRFARHEGHGAEATNEPSAASDGFLQDARDAQRLNAMFAEVDITQPCEDGEVTCSNGQFGQCADSKWVMQSCAGGLRCYAVPTVSEPGTSIVCDSREATLKRFEDLGVSGGIAGETLGSAEDDEDDSIPFCDELPLPTSPSVSAAASTPTAASGSGYAGYRRQAEGPVTLVTLPPSETTSTTPTSTSEPGSTLTVSQSGSEATPTVTIVVISTVTVTPSEETTGGLPTATVSTTSTSTSASISTTSSSTTESSSTSSESSSSASPSVTPPAEEVIVLTAATETSTSSTSTRGPLIFVTNSLSAASAAATTKASGSDY